MAMPDTRSSEELAPSGPNRIDAQSRERQVQVEGHRTGVMPPTRLKKNQAAHPRQREQQDEPFPGAANAAEEPGARGGQRNRQERQAGRVFESIQARQGSQ